MLINYLKNFEASQKAFSEETSCDVLINRNPEIAFSFIMLHFESDFYYFWTLLWTEAICGK